MILSCWPPSRAYVVARCLAALTPVASVLLPRRVLQTHQHQLLWRQLKSLPFFCKHLIHFIHLHEVCSRPTFYTVASRSGQRW